MPADDVPPGDMPWSRAPDPLDAALRGEPVDDPAVEALVADLRVAYLPAAEPQRSPALAAFAGPSAGRAATSPQAVAAAAPGRRRRARIAAAALVGTVTGKVLLGGAVAAAAVGGLHAAQVVDVPVLPDVGRSAPADVPAGDRTPTVEVPAPLPDVAEDSGVVSGGDVQTGPRPPAADASTTPAPAAPADDVTGDPGTDRPTAPPEAPAPEADQPTDPAPPAAAPAPGTAPSSGPATEPAPEPGDGGAADRPDAGAAPEPAPTEPTEDPAPGSPSRP